MVIKSIEQFAAPERKKPRPVSNTLIKISPKLRIYQPTKNLAIFLSYL